MANLVRFKSDYDSIPSQFELQPGTAQANNAVTTGIAPNIALRAIAITGISLSNVNQFNEQWGLSPVTGVSDLKALQILYQYAVTGGDPERKDGVARPFAPQTYNELLSQLRHTVYSSAEKGPDSVKFGRIEAIDSIVGPLPTAPLIDSGGACNGNPTSATYGLTTICFLPGQNIPLDAQSVQSRFLLWVTAITQEIVSTTTTAGSPGAPATGTRSATPNRKPARPRLSGNAPAAPTLQQVPSGLIEEFSIRRRPETLIPPAVTGGGVAILPQ